MIRSNRKRGRQLHLPRVLLRNFAIDHGTGRGREQIWTFDKANDALYRSNIGTVATRADIHEGALNNEKWNIDAGLGAREDQIRSVLTKLSATKALNVLTSEERAWFSIFCAAQVVRVAELRNRKEQMIDAIVGRIRTIGADPKNVNGRIPSDEEETKHGSINSLIQSLQELSHYFAMKRWFIMEAPESHTFYVGDNPIVFHNTRNFGPYSNLRLASSGIEIYLPITSRVTVAMWEPSKLNEVDQLLKDAKSTRKVLRSLDMKQAGQVIDGAIATCGCEIRGLRNLTWAVSEGTSIDASPDQVTFCNALQVMFASRFVYSATSDFSLAKQIIADDSKYRSSAPLQFD
jgi:hypothetical protein